MNDFDYKAQLDHFRSLGYGTEYFDDTGETSEETDRYIQHLERLWSIHLLKNSRKLSKVREIAWPRYN